MWAHTSHFFFLGLLSRQPCLALLVCHLRSRHRPVFTLKMSARVLSRVKICNTMYLLTPALSLRGDCCVFFYGFLLSLGTRVIFAFFTTGEICQVATTPLASTDNFVAIIITTPKSIVGRCDACSAPLAMIGLCVESACVLGNTCEDLAPRAFRQPCLAPLECLLHRSHRPVTMYTQASREFLGRVNFCNRRASRWQNFV